MPHLDWHLHRMEAFRKAKFASRVGFPLGNKCHGAFQATLCSAHVWSRRIFSQASTPAHAFLTFKSSPKGILHITIALETFSEVEMPMQQIFF